MSSAILTAYLQTDLGSKLAFDIVAGLKSPDQVLIDYSLNTQEYELLLAHPGFAQRVAEARAVWSSSMNVSERIKVRAQMQVEDAQVIMTELVHDKQISTVSRIDAFNSLMELAGARKKNQSDAPPVIAGELFTIKFIMDGKEATVLEGEATAVPEPVLALPTPDGLDEAPAYMGSVGAELANDDLCYGVASDEDEPETPPQPGALDHLLRLGSEL